MITYSPEETQALAAEFLAKHLTSNVLALDGDLGSGKTTFVQGLAEALGVNEPVTSPTFILMQSYQTNHKKFQQLIHLDFYRVSGWKDLEMLGLPEIWEKTQNLVVIEWPEGIEGWLPKWAQKLEFKYSGEGKRLIRMQDSGWIKELT